MEKLNKAHSDLYEAYGRQDFSYCDAYLKRGLHKDSAAYLSMLVDELGFDRKDYDIHSNEGGIAGSGEITLHTNTLYVQISQFALSGSYLSFLIRGCESRKDYSGHRNHTLRILPRNLDVVLETCRKAKRREVGV